MMMKITCDRCHADVTEDACYTLQISSVDDDDDSGEEEVCLCQDCTTQFRAFLTGLFEVGESHKEA